MANLLSDSVGEARNNRTIKLVLGIILIVVIIVIVWRVYQGAKKGTAAVGDILTRPIIQEQTGVDAARQLVCEQVAADVREAVRYWWLLGSIMTVSDDDVTRALNRLLTPQEAAYASQHYRTLSGGKSLKAVCESAEYRDASSVKPVIRLNLS